MNRPYLIYLLCINLFAGILFAYDKRAAIGHRRRIPERLLHLLELLGGVFATLLLMFVLRHKNRKFSFYVLTYIILAAWIMIIYTTMR